MKVPRTLILYIAHWSLYRTLVCVKFCETLHGLMQFKDVYLVTLLIFVVSMIAKSTKDLQSSKSCCYATRVDSSSSHMQIRSLFLPLRFSLQFARFADQNNVLEGGSGKYQNVCTFQERKSLWGDRCRHRRSRTQRRENGQAQWTPGTFSCRVQLAWRIISTYYSRVAYKKGTDSSDDTRQSWYGQKPQPTIYRIIPRTKSGEYLDVDSGKASTIATAFVRVISSRDNRIFSICFEPKEPDMYRLS